MSKLLIAFALLASALFTGAGRVASRGVEVGGAVRPGDAGRAADLAAFAPGGFAAPLTADEAEGLRRAHALVRAVNEYRGELGLEEIPYSSWLTYVARYHVYDLETNRPDTGACNMHSWSDQGEWNPCCYTRDHARARCMWDKPRELSGGAYKGNGYEIAAMNSGGMTVYGALEQWKGSPGHHAVIINRGTWANKEWKAVGAAVSAHYAVVWFGD